MNTALALFVFLLGALGVVACLFTRLRRHQDALEGALAGGVFMLIPTVLAEVLWLRYAIGVGCFILWLLLAVYWMNFRHLNRSHGKRRSK